MILRMAGARLLPVLLLVLAVAGCAGGQNRFGGISTAVSADTGSRQADTQPWRASRQTLYASPVTKGLPAQDFSFSGLDAKTVDIDIALPKTRSAVLAVSCDGAFALNIRGLGTRKSDGPQLETGVTADEKSRTAVSVRVGADVQSCIATFRFPSGPRSIRLAREERSADNLLDIDDRRDACDLPATAGLDPLEKVFYDEQRLSQTCPFKLGKPELLKLENEAFNAKVSALLGKPLSASFIEKGDPGAPIDFSLAPRLRLIYLSTLDYKADFSGMVMSRLLRHHAAQGTKIRIQVSSILERTKDARILEELASDFPNVALRKFIYSPKASLSPDELLAGTHRVNHIKLFVALAYDPAKSVSVIGGRNIHDGFLFHQPANLDAYPRLQHYGKRRALTLNYYSNWHDFDIAIHDHRTALTLASHLSTIWLDDSASMSFRPFAKPSTRRGKKQDGQARHFISVPFVDGQALQAYYVDMIDAARERIEIVNPYLNPTEAISKAFDRAIARGVKVEVIGRIDMSGDLGGEILTAVNGAFVEKNSGRMEISDYKAAEVLLHAKILMIDRRLVSVSSVNLNNRSFIHDSENGIVALDRHFYARMRAVFDYYKDDSRPVSGRMPWSAWKLLLLSRMFRNAL